MKVARGVFVPRILERELSLMKFRFCPEVMNPRPHAKLRQKVFPFLL